MAATIDHEPAVAGQERESAGDGADRDDGRPAAANSASVRTGVLAPATSQRVTNCSIGTTTAADTT